MKLVTMSDKTLADEIVMSDSETSTVSEESDSVPEWSLVAKDVPADGSCFFQSIAMAMNDGIDVWYEIEELRMPMEVYWDDFQRNITIGPSSVTADLVRFMSAKNVDKDILDSYNAEAEFRKDQKERGVQVFETEDDLRKYILEPGTWGDQSSFTALLKSLNYNCGILVFDTECGGVKYMPPEWVKNKKLYILLLRRSNHYSPLQLSHMGKDIGMCIDYNTTKKFIEWVEQTNYSKVHCKI